MDKQSVAALLIALVFVVGGVYYARAHGAFEEVGRQDIGHKNAVWMAGAAIVFILVAVPFAVLDGTSRSRFRKEERRMRAERPDAQVSAYAGPEGDGLLFEEPARRTLLLRPLGGLGEPRVVDLAPPEPPVEPSSGPRAHSP